MNDSLFSVSGQVVLISGGTRGIGRALAQGFAERDARVILTGRTEENAVRVAKALGRQAEGIGCDVLNQDQINVVTEKTLAKHGRIDTLINVAGVNRRKLAEDLSLADYEFVVDTNLKGPFLLSQAVGKAMLAAGAGSQINIVSLNNDRPLKGVLPYAISKAGLGHMTRALALEWGPMGVRVNAIAPGFVLTDLTRTLWAQPAMQAWGKTNTPLERLGEPEDLVGAAIFLASKASAFVTGQTLFVDGGFSAGLNWPIDFTRQ